MEHILYNPVYCALTSGDQHLSLGTEKVRYFDEKVSPFAGIEEGYIKGFEELYDLLPADRVILYATPEHINQPKGWELLNKIEGLQFVFDQGNNIKTSSLKLVLLNEQHIDQMVDLATLTKPGPFNTRTIDFGYYFGIFDQDKLVAMTGQRLHPQQYTEISAVCTHPDYLGKGYAHALIQHQLQLILEQRQIPFLHVREDNTRAIDLYNRIGFKVIRGMNFYVMLRKR